MEHFRPPTSLTDLPRLRLSSVQTRPPPLHLPAQRGLCLRPCRIRNPLQLPAVLGPAGAAGGAGDPGPHHHPGARGWVGPQSRPAGSGWDCTHGSSGGTGQKS